MKEACKLLLLLDYNKLIKKWHFILIIGAVGTFIMYFFIRESYVCIFFMLAYIYEHIDRQNILSMANKYRLQKQQEFVNFASYLIIFLENKYNVYYAVKVCIPYLDKCLQSDIEEFLNQIDEDKTIMPYVSLAEKIGTSLVMQMMIMLYQMNVSGYDAKYLTKFPYLIEKAQDLLVKEKINKKRSEVGIYSMVPIIGLMVVVFVMVFSIIGMVGGGVV